jgi:hypothetical protein
MYRSCIASVMFFSADGNTGRGQDTDRSAAFIFGAGRTARTHGDFFLSCILYASTYGLREKREHEQVEERNGEQKRETARTPNPACTSRLGAGTSRPTEPSPFLQSRPGSNSCTACTRGWCYGNWQACAPLRQRHVFSPSTTALRRVTRQATAASRIEVVYHCLFRFLACGLGSHQTRSSSLTSSDGERMVRISINSLSSTQPLP